MSLFHNEVVVWWEENPNPSNKSAIRNRYSRWLNFDKPASYELEPLLINIIGNVANVYYRFKYTGDAISNIGRAGVTFIKQDNKWLIIAFTHASCNKKPLCVGEFYE